jgi:peptidoglycan/xylan/chitin deacetylase (PgdA/CDA1 family)
MNRFKIGRLKHAVQNIQKRVTRQKALILMYHRIAEVNADPWGLCVAPQHFSQQLQVLQSRTHPMSLQTLVRRHQEGTLPQKAVALTFDDGYADNLHNAKPLLEQYEIPATIFVTTGSVGREQEFWWDELEQLLLQTERLPETLSLNINGHSYHWDLGEAAVYSKEEAERDRTYKAWKSQPGSRLFFYYSIWQRLLPLADDDRSAQLDQIRAWAQTETTVRPIYRTLSHDELIELGHSDLVEIGAHTLTHPFLSAQPIDQQQIEIQQSKARLEAIFNCPITSFSYPFGNYAPETVAIAQASGFECACSTIEDFVWRGSSRFELPRVAVEDWNGEEFAEKILGWFNE